MAKIGIFYGSSTGNTRTIAELLHQELAGLADDPVDIADASLEDMMAYDVLLLGIPTWDVGEMQEDWAEVSEELPGLDWSGKRVAVFGCGDQNGYPENFGDALGLLWDLIEPKGAELIGLWPTDGYEFESSVALKDDKFLGMIADFENQEPLNEERVKAWAAQLKGELGVGA